MCYCDYCCDQVYIYVKAHYIKLTSHVCYVTMNTEFDANLLKQLNYMKFFLLVYVASLLHALIS